MSGERQRAMCPKAAEAGTPFFRKRALHSSEKTNPQVDMVYDSPKEKSMVANGLCKTL